MTQQHIALVGGGGHGKVCASIAEDLGFNVVFFDDAFPVVSRCGKWPVIGTSSDLIGRKDAFDYVFVAVGNCVIRKLIQDRLVDAGFDIVNLISKAATIHHSVKLGKGILVVGNACINIDSVIGDGVIVNTNASVDHDCHIGAFAHLCPGVSLAGEVTVGNGTWVGIGSCIIQQISIGKHCLIGAGSVVVNNITDNVKAFGNPAKYISDR